MKQCREELLRKKNQIIQKIRSTKTSMSDMIKTDPRVWDDECFHFDLNSQANILLKADIFVQDPVQRIRARELEEKEAKRKAKEEQDQAKKRELELRFEEMKIKTKAKEKEDRQKIMTKSMEIFVKIYDRKTILLEVQLSNTIQDLKAKIQDKEGIPSIEQNLSYFGKPLRDEITLYDYNINKGRTIELVRNSSINSHLL